MKKEIIIIGAGLTGLTLAYLLKNAGFSIQVIEARNRIGGRIHTVFSANETPIEMGATWISKQHQETRILLEKLKIPVFKQFMEGITLFESSSTAPPQRIQTPPNQAPSYRITGGTIALINGLAASLEAKELILNEKILNIRYTKNNFEINASNNQYHAAEVVSTIPPMLLVNSIKFYPELPKKIIEVANKTHTWMGESIKFGISYSKPFWKENQYSGTVFSNVGPITELYDHSDDKGTKFALKGFLQGEMHSDTRENRKSKVIDQLQKLFGKIALEYLVYEELIWKTESTTSIKNEDYMFPHQNNGHAIYQKPIINNHFFIAGAETSPQFGGYMEGAIQSALSTFQKLKKINTSK